MVDVEAGGAELVVVVMVVERVALEVEVLVVVVVPEDAVAYQTLLTSPLLDRFYARSRALELVNNAVEGMMKAADRRAIPPLRSQLEKRKLNHPGYQPPDL